MKVRLFGPNLRNPQTATFHAHRDGCQHEAQYGPGKKYGGDDSGWVIDVNTRLAVVCEVYPPSEYDWDPKEDADAYLTDVHFAPCLNDLEVGT